MVVNKPHCSPRYTKTYAWDVTDLQNPTLSTVFESSEKSIDHNQYIIGDLTYQVRLGGDMVEGPTATQGSEFDPFHLCD